MPTLQVYSNSRIDIKNALKCTESGIPRIMGIVNVTPDSFHSASRKTTLESALQASLNMIGNGATWIDIGGESTRPGASEVSTDEEMKRVIPVIKNLKEKFPNVLISIDTRKAEVARNAIKAGALMINDVSGFKDKEMMNVAVENQVAVCIMHMQGNPQNMQNQPNYIDCRSEIYGELKQKAISLVEMGLSPELIVLDPGIGFGKQQQHNIELLQDISELKDLNNEKSPKCGWNTMWGVSRKSIIGQITEQENPEDRLAGTLATAAQAKLLGVDMLRVHDVVEHRDFLNVFSRLRED